MRFKDTVWGKGGKVRWVRWNRAGSGTSHHGGLADGTRARHNETTRAEWRERQRGQLLRGR